MILTSILASPNLSKSIQNKKKDKKTSEKKLENETPAQHGNTPSFGPIGAKAQRPEGPVASEARWFEPHQKRQWPPKVGPANFTIR